MVTRIQVLGCNGCQDNHGLVFQWRESDCNRVVDYNSEKQN